MGFFSKLHKITGWIDPGTHYALDATHKSSTALVGETSHAIGNIFGDTWLGNAGKHWDEMADKDKADFNRWATNTALTAGAVYGGMTAAEAAGAGAGSGAAGAAEGGVAAGNGAFLGEGVQSGIGAWDAAAGYGAELGAGAGAAAGDGAFLGEGVQSGVGAWDGAAGYGGDSGMATSSFDPNGMPNGSQYASDIPNGSAAASGGGGNAGYLQAIQSGLGAASSLYAARMQSRAAQDAMNATLAQSAQARADSAPWRLAGGDAVGLMSAGVQPGGYFAHQFNKNDLNAELAPNYAFMLDQGQRANQNAAGVAGGLVGGNALQGLNKWTQDYAQNAYQQAYQNYTANQTNIFNRLSSIAGLGQTANQANSVLASNNMSNANNYLTSGAAANAAGIVGATNNVNNGINNYLGWQYLNSKP